MFGESYYQKNPGTVSYPGATNQLTKTTILKVTKNFYDHSGKFVIIKSLYLELKIMKFVLSKF